MSACWGNMILTPSKFGYFCLARNILIIHNLLKKSQNCWNEPTLRIELWIVPKWKCTDLEQKSIRITDCEWEPNTKQLFLTARVLESFVIICFNEAWKSVLGLGAHHSAPVRRQGALLHLNVAAPIAARPIALAVVSLCNRHRNVIIKRFAVKLWQK